MIDIVLRYDDELGFLPILRIDNCEVYRGEYQEHASDALERCQLAMRKQAQKLKS